MNQVNASYSVFNKIYLHSLKNLAKSWMFYVILAIALIVFFFMTTVLPTLLGYKLTAYYADTPTWLTNVFTTTIIVNVVFSAIIGELIAQKSEVIYLLTKNISRNKVLMSKFISTITINLLFALLCFSFYFFMDIACYETRGGDELRLFSLDIHWYALLIDFFLVSVFGSLSVIIVYNVRYGVSIILLTAIASTYVLLFPMIWYVDNPTNYVPDTHRLWFVEYGPPIIYIPFIIVFSVPFILWFNNKRINI